MKSVVPFTPAVMLLVLAIGCQKAIEPTQQASQYDLTATVSAVNPDKQTVTLDHEDIPGLMKGMEMEFKIEGPAVIEGINAGDHVHGRLKVESGEYTVIHLEKH